MHVFEALTATAEETYDEAEKQYREFLEEEKDNNYCQLWGYIHFADLLRKRGKWEEMIFYYRQGLDRSVTQYPNDRDNPAHFWPLYRLSLGYEALPDSRLDLALQWILKGKRILELRPNIGESDRGLCYERIADICKEMPATAKQNAVIYYRLKSLYEYIAYHHPIKKPLAALEKLLTILDGDNKKEFEALKLELQRLEKITAQVTDKARKLIALHPVYLETKEQKERSGRDSPNLFGFFQPALEKQSETALLQSGATFSYFSFAK